MQKNLSDPEVFTVGISILLYQNCYLIIIYKSNKSEENTYTPITFSNSKGQHGRKLSDNSTSLAFSKALIIITYYYAF